MSPEVYNSCDAKIWSMEVDWRDSIKVRPFPRMTLSWTTFQSAPLSNDILKFLSFVIGWASFKPHEYGKV